MNRTNRSHIYSALSNWHDYGVLSQTREIFLESGDEGIGSKHAVEFIKNLVMLESLSDDPIIVHQYNIGGDQNAGFAIYDAIKASKCKFLFICYGSASSMGSIIPQAVIGKGLRVTHPHTEWLIHEGSCETSGTTKQFISNAEALKRSKELMYDIYVNACKNGANFKGKRYWTDSRLLTMASQMYCLARAKTPRLKILLRDSNEKRKHRKDTSRCLVRNQCRRRRTIQSYGFSILRSG